MVNAPDRWSGAFTVRYVVWAAGRVVTVDAASVVANQVAETPAAGTVWRHGARFTVEDFREHTLVASTTSGTEEWTRENGLSILDRSAYVGEFPYVEVDNLHEVRSNLLAQWREEDEESE